MCKACEIMEPKFRALIGRTDITTTELKDLATEKAKLIIDMIRESSSNPDKMERNRDGLFYADKLIDLIGQIGPVPDGIPVDVVVTGNNFKIVFRNQSVMHPAPDITM